MLFERKERYVYNLPMNRKLQEAYEALEDASLYAAKDYLRLNLNPQEEKAIAILNAAAGYLYGRYILGEVPDASYTEFLIEAQGDLFAPSELGNKASVLRLRMIDKDFAKKETHLVHYLNFLSETELYVNSALFDEPGRLALAYIEEYIEILLPKKEQKLEYLRLSEVAFLNLTNAFALLYREHFQEKFKNLKSAPFFIAVSEAHERIRGEILD